MPIDAQVEDCTASLKSAIAENHRHISYVHVANAEKCKQFVDWAEDWIEKREMAAQTEEKGMLGDDVLSHEYLSGLDDKCGVFREVYDKFRRVRERAGH